MNLVWILRRRLNIKTITENTSLSTFVLKAIATIEAATGLGLLGWALFELQQNGWSLHIKGIPGSDVHLVIVGMIYLAAATGTGLLIAAAGIALAKKWPFALHMPLAVFLVFISIRA